MPRAAVPLAVLLLATALGASANTDFRVLGGHAYGLEDTPPHAWLAGGAVTAALGPRVRVGLEVLHAHMFGFEYFERRATLFNPIVEYHFAPDSRFSPYVTGGLGFTLYRSLYPSGPDPQRLEWEYGGSFNLGGGGGVRIFLTKRLFVSPEVRLGWIPFIRSTIAVGYRF